MAHLAMIIEDEGGLRAIYRRVLGDMGCTLIEAADGASALDLLAHHTPDVIFLDLLLPEVSGAEVLNFIQHTPHLSHTRVVIVSAHREIEQQIADVANFQFVLKPIRPAQIRQFASGTAVG
jgi:CheY-like chemotaxis protein